MSGLKNLVSPPKAAPLSLPKPQPVRMPTETDPDVVAAGKRARDRARQRQGRLSTILTDQTREVVGSSGQKLGA